MAGKLTYKVPAFVKAQDPFQGIVSVSGCNPDATIAVTVEQQTDGGPVRHSLSVAADGSGRGELMHKLVIQSQGEVTLVVSGVDDFGNQLDPDIQTFKAL